MADGFDTHITHDGDALVGPFRSPKQMLAEQEYDGHTSVHDDETAEKLGRSGMASRVEAVVAISAIKDTLGQALESMAHVEHQLVMRRSFDGVRLDA